MTFIFLPTYFSVSGGAQIQLAKLKFFVSMKIVELFCGRILPNELILSQKEFQAGLLKLLGLSSFS